MSKKLVEYHILRLKDKNPAVRLKSIQELLLLNDSDALAVLQEVYKNDPDGTVRRAAQKAGREIFLRNRDTDVTSR